MSVEPSLVDVSLTEEHLVGDTTITDVAAGATLSVGFSSTQDGQFMDDGWIFEWQLEDDTGSSDALDISLSGEDTDKDQVAEGQVGLVLTAKGIEEFNVNSTMTTASEDSSPGADDALTNDEYINFLELDADSVTDINIVLPEKI